MEVLKMKIRKLKNNILNKFKNTTEEITLSTFIMNNFTYTIKGIENQNIIIIYKEDTKTEFFEIELFEIV